MRQSAAYIVFVFFLTLAFEAQAGFSPCHFNFGMAWQGGEHHYPSELDFVTIWAGSDEDFNQYWHGAMLQACKSGGKLAGVTPVYYSYIIAFTARRDWGLQDCNVGTPSLCQKGANYIREHKSRITGQYDKYAAATAQIWGTSQPIIWLMEPDFYQYADATQEGGGLSWSVLGDLMHELVSIIKGHLPNAVISMDISPWITDQSGWFSAFTMSDFTYMNTSGGGTDADGDRIRSVNHTTWSGIHSLTGKAIIADDGYGVGGGSTGHDDSWDVVANINARIADGVIGIMQANPRGDWGSIIASIRPQLDTPLTCGNGGGQSPSRFSLSVTTAGGGTVSIDPLQSAYDSGTVVTLSATPLDGAEFIGWSEDLSGTDNPATVAMDRDRGITASFTQSNAVSGELIRNGSFANGSNDWTFGAHEGAAAHESFTNGFFYSATTAAGSAWWHIQLYQDALQLQQGLDYALQFQAAADEPATIQVNIGMSASPWTSYSGGREIDLSAAMQTYTIQFAMDQPTNAAARVEFNAGLSAIPWRLDNVSLTGQVSAEARVMHRESNQPLAFRNNRLRLPDSAPRDATVALLDITGKVLYQTVARNRMAPIPATVGAGLYLLRYSAGSGAMAAPLLICR